MLGSISAPSRLAGKVIGHAIVSQRVEHDYAVPAQRSCGVEPSIFASHRQEFSYLLFYLHMGGCASRQRTSARRLAVRLIGNLGVVDAARSDYSRAASHPYTFRLSLTRSSFPVCNELIVSRLVATLKVEHVYDWRASAGQVEPARSQPLHGDRRRNSQPQAAIVL